MLRALRSGAGVLALLAAAPLAAQAPERRPVQVDDLYRLRDVRDPQLSPDGRWVAYTLTVADSARDRNETDVWMVSWDGAQDLRLTSTPGSESRPRWSPDGRYLAFTSSRQEGDGAQVWLLDRRGGEAARLTEVEGGVSGYEWSPDGSRLVLVVRDPEPADSADGERPRPIVVDRYQFKNDGDGYLDSRATHLYLFDVAARRMEPLTTGPYSEGQPAWSPDGRWIAFVSKRGDDPDRSNDSNVFVVEARPGATPRQLTTHPGPDRGPLAWSPDGATLAYLQGGEPQNSAYNMDRLAVVPLEGGAPRVVTADLDRAVSAPAWTPDGRAVLVTITDDRAEHLARVDARSGRVERLIQGRRVVGAFSTGEEGGVAALVASATAPAEVHALERGRLRKLTGHNDAWLATVRLATTEDFTFTSPDGAVVNGLMVKPADYVAGRRYPTLLRVHGGPNGQDQHSFNLERETFAAHGYVVLAVNYRGSSGRGEAFQTTIFADWGNKEVVDLLAATDHAVQIGVADPDRLGIGGWSYGAILTNAVIATTPRFKAATSGAGASLWLSMYGSDQYIRQYEMEFGRPWENPETWLKVSYPFLHADRISTPTLFMVGEDDFNVPVVGSEQMYQALRSLGVPTQLVIYPGENHGISRPSFRLDRVQRYLDWYGRYLLGESTDR